MPRRTARSDRFQLCSPIAEDGTVRVVRHIKLDEGHGMVYRGSATYVEDAEGVIIGFQQTGDERMQRLGIANVFVLRDSVAHPSNTGFSRTEIALIAGQVFRKGGSRTAGLSEEQRAERIRMGWMAEDAVERAREKLIAYDVTH